MLVIVLAGMAAASTITTGNDGTDMVGNYQNYCRLEFPDATGACDYNFYSHGWGNYIYNSGTPTIYDRTLFVGFS